jgi:hypothetical protein
MMPKSSKSKSQNTKQKSPSHLISSLSQNKSAAPKYIYHGVQDRNGGAGASALAFFISLPTYLSIIPQYHHTYDMI